MNWILKIILPYKYLFSLLKTVKIGIFHCNVVAMLQLVDYFLLNVVYTFKILSLHELSFSADEL
jgi:hypothetical protein